jgi:hypothetical protein
MWIFWGMCLLTVILPPAIAANTPNGFFIEPGDWPADPRSGPRSSVTSFKLNDFDTHLDGQWEGSKVASDGNVYFFSSTHGGGKDGASMFRYNPSTKALTELISDITVACGETNAGWNPGQTVPQGKVHSDIVEYNGWLYASTHLADESRRVDWGGSHAFAYNMATGQFKDFGILKYRYTCYAGLTIDPVRDYLYVFGSPSYSTEQNDPSPNGGPHMIRYDLTANSAPYGRTDLGRITTFGSANLYQFTDKRGDTWFTLLEDAGALYKIPAGTSTFLRIPNAIPFKTDPITGAATSTRGIWGWGQPLPGGDKFLFNQSININTSSGGLWTFDASKVVGTDTSQAFTFIKHIGPTNLGCAYDSGDNTMYFTRQVTDLSNPNPHSVNAQGDANHLMSLDLATNLIKDWGLIEDQLGRRPWRVESMCAADGKVFFSADWYMLSDGGNPASTTESGTYRYQSASHTYIPYTRGQFFAVANVPEPTLGLILLAGLLWRSSCR